MRTFLLVAAMVILGCALLWNGLDLLFPTVYYKDTLTRKIVGCGLLVVFVLVAKSLLKRKYPN